MSIENNLIVLNHILKPMYRSDINIYYCKTCGIDKVFLRSLEDKYMFFGKNSIKAKYLELTCEEQLIKNLLE